MEGNQESAIDSQDPELRKEVFPYQDHAPETMDQSSDVAVPYNNYPVQPWSRSWYRSWTFRWRIGVLTVRTTASQQRVRQQEFHAFKHGKARSTRYSYLVSVDFRPAPSLLIARGISIQCQSQQDQRGFYEICPRLITFAIVPNDAEVFECVRNRDLAGLKLLFETGQAAPTDRTDELDSLLHVRNCLR